MKKVIVVICVIAMLLNMSYLGFLGYKEFFDSEGPGGAGGGGGGDPGSDGSDGGDGSDDSDGTLIDVDPETFTVKLPPRMLYERLVYDYDLFSELYSENVSSGEYERYTLTGDGELIQDIPGVGSEEDGFKEMHNAICFREMTSANFNIIVSKSDQDSDMVATGQLNADRNEYKAIQGKKTIKTVTSGDVALQDFSNGNIKTPMDINYDGKLRSYPDVNTPLPTTIDQSIYNGGQTLKLNDSGQYIERDVDYEWMMHVYNWTIDRAEKISGYNCLRINITSSFWNFLNLQWYVWISNEVPLPVKAYARTNASWDEVDDDGYEKSGYTIIELTRQLQVDGYTTDETRSEVLPWTDSPGNYSLKNSQGDFERWSRMPATGGDVDPEGIYFTSEEAIADALNQSEGLKDFMAVNDYDNTVVLRSAVFNYTRDPIKHVDRDGKAGLYMWNLTFARKAEDDGDRYDDDNYCYNIRIDREIIKNKLTQDYTVTDRIGDEVGRRHGWTADYAPDELNTDLLTMSSSLDLMKSDSDISQKGFDDGKLNTDSSYAASMTGVQTSSMPGMSIIQTLTGIETPQSMYSWVLQSQTVYEQGSTFSAAVDVQTGELIYVMEVKGTILNQIFG